MALTDAQMQELQRDIAEATNVQKQIAYIVRKSAEKPLNIVEREMLLSFRCKAIKLNANIQKLQRMMQVGA